MNSECDFSANNHGEGTDEWFATKLGLCNEGIDICKELDDMHASLTKCEAV